MKFKPVKLPLNTLIHKTWRDIIEYFYIRWTNRVLYEVYTANILKQDEPIELIASVLLGMGIQVYLTEIDFNQTEREVFKLLCQILIPGNDISLLTNVNENESYKRLVLVVEEGNEFFIVLVKEGVYYEVKVNDFKDNILYNDEGTYNILHNKVTLNEDIEIEVDLVTEEDLIQSRSFLNKFLLDDSFERKLVICDQYTFELFSNHRKGLKYRLTTSNGVLKRKIFCQYQPLESFLHSIKIDVESSRLFYLFERGRPDCLVSIDVQHGKEMTQTYSKFQPFEIEEVKENYSLVIGNDVKSISSNGIVILNYISNGTSNRKQTLRLCYYIIGVDRNHNTSCGSVRALQTKALDEPYVVMFPNINVNRLLLLDNTDYLLDLPVHEISDKDLNEMKTIWQDLNLDTDEIKPDINRSDQTKSLLTKVKTGNVNSLNVSQEPLTMKECCKVVLKLAEPGVISGGREAKENFMKTRGILLDSYKAELLHRVALIEEMNDDSSVQQELTARRLKSAEATSLLRFKELEGLLRTDCP